MASPISLSCLYVNGQKKRKQETTDVVLKDKNHALRQDENKCQ